MKKWIAGLLALSMCIAFAACSEKPVETTGNTTGMTESTVSTTTGTPEESTAVTEETTSKPDETTEITPDPEPAMDGLDMETVQVGRYVTLRYNGVASDVTFDVKKGVGSKETVTLTAKMKDTFLFDGWTEDGAIVNGKPPVGDALTYSFTATEPVTVFCNTSMTLRYHENGGEIAKKGFDGTDTPSCVYFQNPSTLPEQKYFTREGYTLIGYNTEADGSGEQVSIGAPVTANGKGTIDMYCVWAKDSPVSDFDMLIDGNKAIVSAYLGNSETVVIPERYEGKPITEIDSGAFDGCHIVKTVVVGKSVKIINRNAFRDMQSLETVVLFETVNRMDDNNFKDCPNFKNVRINSLKGRLDVFTSAMAGKLDRLITMKDRKKIVIVGGSGSDYGFDSAILDEALNGEYEIINFGENANVTAVVYFDIIEDFITDGDIVLWCPEPGRNTLGTSTCGYRFWYCRSSNYDFTKYINPSYYDDFFSSFANHAASLSGEKAKSADILPPTMTKYGDDMGNRKWDGKKYDYYFDYRMQAYTTMCELVKNITAKGGKVFYSFAAMQKSGFESSDKAGAGRLEKLVTSVPGITSISKVENCVYEDTLFWNSPWHLNDEGAKVRSEHVAEDLKAALAIS